MTGPMYIISEARMKREGRREGKGKRGREEEEEEAEEWKETTSSGQI